MEKNKYTIDDLSVDELRAIEFSHCKGTDGRVFVYIYNTSAIGIYLDHAGATLYSSSQIKSAMTELLTDTCGNPHSQNSASQVTRSKIQHVRALVLDFFNVTGEEYDVVFTSGATESLRLVAECFPWSSASEFCYTFNSHTSVVGMRSYAKQAGASCTALSMQEVETLERISVDVKSDSRVISSTGPFHLMVFPAECNFSGMRHNLNIAQQVRKHGIEGHLDGQWRSLVDVSKYVATSRLDLRTVQADFVVLSFYKMFGYPTGLGVLLVRKETGHCLKKQYFGGGTVRAILCDTDFCEPRHSTAESFEDGTESFLSILSLKYGFEALNRIGMDNIQKHTSLLITTLYRKLRDFRHFNGQKVCIFYGNHEKYAPELQGPVITCNFLRPDGSYIGYAEVERMASLYNIQIRTGCFCNPGACQYYLELSNQDILDNVSAGHVCGDNVDIINGRPTGAVRISLGYMTAESDIDAFSGFIQDHFVSMRQETEPEPLDQQLLSYIDQSGVLKLLEMYIYPIKSCAAMNVKRWPIVSTGFMYDREWLIVDSLGKTLRLKDEPKLCMIQPVIDLCSNTLTINAPELDMDPLALDLGADNSAHKRTVQICGLERAGVQQNPSSSEWLTKCLGYTCSLIRRRKLTSDSIGENFANQGQFLLITTASVNRLNERLSGTNAPQQQHLNRETGVDYMAFRPNLVVGGSSHANEEDSWSKIRIGSATFEVTGPCRRCNQINVHPKTGKYDGAPLKELSKYRREKSSIYFGQFLAHRLDVERPESAIARGDHIIVLGING